MIIWITGQPGAGKSTLARALEAALNAQGCQVARLDGDELRRCSGNHDYSDTGRIHNVKAGHKTATDCAARGLVVVAAFVSPHRWLREELKSCHEVLEVFVHTNVPTPKDVFHVPAYEIPLAQFTDINTACLSVEESVQKIMAEMMSSRRK